MSLGGQDREHDDGQLRILHWNIHSWRDASGAPNLEAVGSLIRRTGPDVVSLTEVAAAWGRPAVLRDLAGRGGYSWLYVPAFEYGTPAAGFGNALLTRLPIRAAQQWQLLWPARQYDGSEPSEPRAALFAQVEFGRVPVWVGTTHLPRSDPFARAKALERLMELTGGLGGPWLLCGDFNTGPSWLPGGGQVTVRPDPVQPTHPADDPVEPIDYCLAAPGIGLTAEVLPAAGSDHLPVLALARLPAPG